MSAIRGFQRICQRKRSIAKAAQRFVEEVFLRERVERNLARAATVLLVYLSGVFILQRAIMQVERGSALDFLQHEPQRQLFAALNGKRAGITVIVKHFVGVRFELESARLERFFVMERKAQFQQVDAECARVLQFAQDVQHFIVCAGHNGHLYHHSRNNAYRCTDVIPRALLVFGRIIKLDAEANLVKSRCTQLFKKLGRELIARGVQAQVSIRVVLARFFEKRACFIGEQKRLAARERYVIKSVHAFIECGKLAAPIFFIVLVKMVVALILVEAKPARPMACQ